MIDERVSWDTRHRSLNVTRTVAWSPLNRREPLDERSKRLWQTVKQWTCPAGILVDKQVLDRTRTGRQVLGIASTFQCLDQLLALIFAQQLRGSGGKELLGRRLPFQRNDSVADERTAGRHRLNHADEIVIGAQGRNTGQSTLHARISGRHRANEPPYENPTTALRSTPARAMNGPVLIRR